MNGRMQTQVPRHSTPLGVRSDGWLLELTRQLGAACWNTFGGAWLEAVRERIDLNERDVTVLVTDLVGFTGLVESLGDLAARDLIKKHNRMLRACLREYHGREAAHTGDGIIASFATSTDAIDCAIRMQARLADFRAATPDAPLHARIGLHAGRTLPEEGRLFGTAVILAVRVCSLTPADSILVSSAVRDLANPRYAYEDCGLIKLKGLREPQRLYAIQSFDPQRSCAALHLAV